MTQLYGRKVQVTVSPKGSETALDLSAMRIRFQVIQSTLETPNTADVRVYNLSDRTIANLTQGGEFTRVRVSAGYEGSYGLIFDGTVVQTRAGRENRTDTYFDLICADGDIAYNYAVTKQSIKAGAKAEDVLKAVTASMAEHGVTQGYTPKLSGQASPRGRTLFGMAREYMRDIAETNNCTWSIQNGKTQLLGNGEALPDEALVLTSETGMVGLPEQTQLGIVVRMLLNPNVKIGRRVFINNKSIQRLRIDTSYQGYKQQAFLPNVSDDGYYRVIVADHYGDTRGNTYYTEAICIKLGDPLSPGLLQRGKDVP